MGHFEMKSLIALVLLAVLCGEKTFVKGQSPLQIEPSDPYSLLHPTQKHSNVKPVISDTLSQQLDKLQAAHDINPLDNQTLPWRLPREVLPIRYTVQISPVLDAGQDLVAERWFTPGYVDISIRAQRDTDKIVIHSKNISIELITVSLGSTNIPVTGNSTGEYDFLTITLGEELKEGQTYMLSIKFKSFITEDLNGLYRSSYVNPDTNQTVWLATTQMEALHARQLFPCFDEPAIKSVFHFTIGRMTKYISLFNTESTGTTPGPADGWVYESYRVTPTMSTYLLALIISEFKFEEAPADLFPGKKVRTYAPEHYIREKAGVYAAENAAKVLSYFSTYFDHTYPISKMDSAAVPDFYFGAMENYGLNIYRETALLVFPEVSLESERWSITSVIGHELAHQWFGNLVTPAWWTHIWLNEGFATYFAAVAATHTNPEFESSKRFLNDAVQRSMEFAADPSYAHPVKIGEVEWKRKDAMDWFGRMVYEQAGSLIRMMDGFLTTSVLKAALTTYVHQLEFRSAQQDDLFRHLNTLAKAMNKIPEHLTIKEIMDTWTLKPGFPLVRVNKASSNRVYVSQEKFTLNMAMMHAGKVDADNELWHIPISVATRSNPDFDPSPERWLDKDIVMTSWEINAEEWMILNAGVSGYYRVLYDIPLTNLIKAQLDSNYTVIEPMTRSQLLDDYFTAGYQRYVSLLHALELTSYLSSANETEIIVWNTLLKHLRKPLNLLPSSGGAIYGSFRNYILPKIKRAVNAVGGIEAKFAERAGMPILRHQQFTDWACALEDDECQTFSVNQVNEWKTTLNNTIPRDIQQTVYCAAVAKGTDDVFQFIKERYNDTATSTIQRNRLLNALACTTDTGAARELLDGSITSGYYKIPADGSRILGRLAMTPLGRSAVLRFIRENALPIRDYFGNAEPIRTVYSTVATYASTKTEHNELQTIADEISAVISDIIESINQSIATVLSNNAWVEEFSPSFSSYFTANNY